MSQVVSLRLPDTQAQRLKRLARRLGRSPSETGSLLIEEALRQTEFAQIEFRNSPVGRQAYMKGSTLAVWEVTLIAESYGFKAESTAKHLNWPAYRVQAALNYAEAFPEEIRLAVEENRAMDFDTLKRLLPGLERVIISGRKGERK
jgi:hypothetical protein